MKKLSLSLLFDWYFMLACQFALWQVPVRDDGENRDVRRASLHSRVDYTINMLTRRLSHRIAGYLWSASFGEARHVGSRTGDGRYPDNLPVSPAYYRDGASHQAFNFSLTLENIDKLEKVFSANDWVSGYGGDAWGSIVSALRFYVKGADDPRYLGLFLDHIVDLAHNGGALFDKSYARDLVKLDYGEMSESSFKRFLNYKRDHNIIDTCEYFAMLSSSTREIVIMVKRALGHDTTNLIAADGFLGQVYHNTVVYWGDEIIPQYGDEELSDNYEYADSTHCHRCGDYVSQGNALLDPQGDYEYCPDCWSELFYSCADCHEECSFKYNGDNTNPDGEYVCEECFSQNYSTCDKCGEVTTDALTEVDGDEWYCDDCLSKYCSVCKGCDEWVTDRHMYEIDGDYSYCEDCLDSYEAGTAKWVCEVCGKPNIKSALSHHMGDVHNTCEGECEKQFLASHGYLQGQTELPGFSYKFDYEYTAAFGKPPVYASVASL